MTVKAVKTASVSAEALEAAREKRRQAAREAFEKNAYQIRFSGKDDQGRYAWEVQNGEGQTYIVSLADGRYACTCPDFANRGAQLGLCKHTELVRLRREALKQAKAGGASGPSAPTPPTPNGRTDRAPEAPAAPQSTEDPEAVVVHWGKHKGKTLGQLAREAPGFIAWLAFKMEARSDEDRRLQEAARKVHDRLKLKAEKGEKKARGQSRGADPVAGFIAAAGIELLKELWKAQSGGRDLSDPAIQKALELRLQAIRRVAELLRQI
jgi:hypothetical protein